MPTLTRTLMLLGAGLAVAVSSNLAAAQQPVGFATLPAGSLNYVTASAIAKVLKEKAGMNVLVQPTAGDAVILPMVNRNEAAIGISNILEVTDAVNGAAKIGKQPHLRLIGVPHTFRGTFWVKKDSPMKTIADLKGKRVPLGYSAMLTIDRLARAILAIGGLTEKDVTPVLVPNVVRGADSFASGDTDVFFFAFGAPKVREVDATVGGIRALDIPASGMPAAKKIFSYGYSDQGRAESVLRWRHPSDGRLRLGQSADHKRQSAGRRHLQDHRHAGEQQSRPGGGTAGAARVIDAEIVHGL